MPPKKTVRRRERRRMSRADAQLSMRVEGASADAALAPIVTESRNISGSGVYCVSPHYVAPLSKVAVTLVLPGLPGRTPRRRLLKCEGVVVRCQNQVLTGKERAFELACSFLGLEDDTRQLLDEYVMWRNLESMRGAAASRRTTGRASRNGAAPKRAATGLRNGARAARPRRRATGGTRRRKTVH